MIIIKIRPNDNGGHNNQTTSAPIPVPDGWAVVPEEMLPLEHFPFGEAIVADISGIPTVTDWTPLPLPAPDPEPEPEPALEKRNRADIDFLAALQGVEL